MSFMNQPFGVVFLGGLGMPHDLAVGEFTRGEVCKLVPAVQPVVLALE